MASEVTRRRFIETAAVVGTGAAAISAGESDAARGGKIKIIGVCCSPRKGKNTSIALKAALDAAAEAGAETEMIELAGLAIPGEPAARVELAPGQKDDFPSLVPRLSAPEVAGIIIGTPVYFGNMSFLCKAFLDRCVVFRRTFAWGDRIGGVIAVGGCRNGGQELTVKSVQTCLMGQEMILVGDARPTGHWGGTAWSAAPGGIKKDEFGMKTAGALGRRVAEVAMKFNGLKAGG